MESDFDSFMERTGRVTKHDPAIHGPLKYDVPEESKSYGQRVRDAWSGAREGTKASSAPAIRLGEGNCEAMVTDHFYYTQKAPADVRRAWKRAQRKETFTQASVSVARTVATIANRIGF